MRPQSAFEATEAWSPDGGYVIAGSVLETANAGVVLAVWCIRTGSVNGIDVSGQVVVTSDGGSAGGGVLLVDECATPEQTLALVDAFSGRLGGPLADPAAGWPPDLSLARVPLRYRSFRWRFPAPRRSS